MTGQFLGLVSDGRKYFGSNEAQAFKAIVAEHYLRTRNAPSAEAVAAAVDAATLSPCRSRRGVAIFWRDDVYATGYNHQPKPFECDGTDHCKATCRHTAVHAEQFAILRGVARPGGIEGREMVHVKVVGADFVASGPPSCVQCSKLILASGIAAMWLFHYDGWRRYPADEFHWLSSLAVRA